jgi:hypothetical protein
MSLDRVKMETSASQFVLWMEYLEWEINAFDKTCYYLAQIAAEVRRPNVKKGVFVKVEDFIMKFTHKDPVKPTPIDVQTRADRAKRFFFGLTGLTGRGKKGKSRP